MEGFFSLFRFITAFAATLKLWESFRSRINVCHPFAPLCGSKRIQMGGKGYIKKEVKHKHYRKGGGGDEPNRNRTAKNRYDLQKLSVILSLPWLESVLKENCLSVYVCAMEENQIRKRERKKNHHVDVFPPVLLIFHFACISHFASAKHCIYCFCLSLSFAPCTTDMHLLLSLTSLRDFCFSLLQFFLRLLKQLLLRCMPHGARVCILASHICTIVQIGPCRVEIEACVNRGWAASQPPTHLPCDNSRVQIVRRRAGGGAFLGKRENKEIGWNLE